MNHVVFFGFIPVYTLVVHIIRLILNVRTIYIYKTYPEELNSEIDEDEEKDTSNFMREEDTTLIVQET